MLAQTQDGVRGPLHIHASSTRTHHEAYRERVPVGRERYGEPTLGSQLSAVLADTASLKEDQGEVFAGRDLLLFEQIADRAPLAGTST
ncbi:hypothetical protein ACIBPB_10085 [Micromonospora sp. NPDC049836]|uniref:hypothetical protein n=1 Tax=Micromonospora sp. NPDC049836 TaxID=3364274 RepID=UPI0037B2113B